ncbi:MAG: hypothetical protein RH946_14315 [Rhodospirillales bacterium]
MATVPKTTALAPAAPAHSVRTVGPSARVASVSTSQIDALNAGTNISFDAAASGFQDEQNNTQLKRESGQRRQYSDPGFDRLFTADTQVFAKIFEEQEKPAATQGRNREQARSIDRPVSSVIKTYETNALVISGQQPMNGTTFSFNL